MLYVVWPIDTCPPGYKHVTGAIQHRGIVVNNQTKHSENVTDCGNICNSNRECKSFEFSASIKHCKLNRGANPDTNIDRGDFVFCSKIGKWANAIRQSIFICQSK